MPCGVMLQDNNSFFAYSQTLRVLQQMHTVPMEDVLVSSPAAALRSGKGLSRRSSGHSAPAPLLKVNLPAYLADHALYDLSSVIVMEKLKLLPQAMQTR